jgi:hypothetical protein
VTTAETRRLSAALFGNDKFAEVVVALETLGRTATAQEIANEIRVGHDLVRKVLLRLSDAHLVKARERIGGRRGALPYEVTSNPEWGVLVNMCRSLIREGSSGHE